MASASEKLIRNTVDFTNRAPLLFAFAVCSQLRHAQWNTGNEFPIFKPESAVIFLSSILMFSIRGPIAREKKKGTAAIED